VKSLLFRARQNLKERLARFVAPDAEGAAEEAEKKGETFGRGRR
jgi:hypothetical protein